MGIDLSVLQRNRGREVDFDEVIYTLHILELAILAERGGRGQVRF